FEFGFLNTTAAQRQGEVDDVSHGSFSKTPGFRTGTDRRKAERGAVGEQPFAVFELEFADGQCRAVYFYPAETPEEGFRGEAALMDAVLQIALLLLKVL